MASAIIVFSHLRWGPVFQRPQQLLLRLARTYPIVFIEEPDYDDKNAFLEMTMPAPNILVCRPHTPVNMPGFHDDQLPYLQKMIRQVVRDYDDHIAWFTTPMALPLWQETHPRLVVYDCMEELPMVENAPKQLPQRENGLLKLADIVLAGGLSLYHSLRDRHPNVHLFPSCVDPSDFVQALDRANSHPAHKDIPGPRLGFYGTIDERFDADLIEKVADAHTQWQIVLVGPVQRIAPATLPQRANIHYLGPHPHDALPHFLAGWDVCLLPFASNESIRFINPVTALEYMAAELPVVSTPVADVAGLYGDVVTIAEDAPSFIAACEAALLAGPQEHAARVDKMRAKVASACWDNTAERIRTLLENTPRSEGKAEGAPSVEEAAEAAPNVNRLRQPEPAQFAQTPAAGSGATGPSAACQAGDDTVLFEKNAMVAK